MAKEKQKRGKSTCRQRFTRFVLIVSAILCTFIYLIGSNLSSQTASRTNATQTAIFATQSILHPDVTYMSSQTYYVSRSANVRSCPDTDCDIIGRLAMGQSINVDGVADGVIVSGSPEWYHMRYQGKTAYVHSSLVSQTRPAQPTQPVSSIQSQPSNSGGSSGVSCGGATTCGQMTSCAQAYACLRESNGRLDGNNNGIPCESICGG